MWRQAIAHLNQVPPYSANYTAAQLKEKDLSEKPSGNSEAIRDRNPA